VEARNEKVGQLVDHLFRREVGRMVPRLTRILGAGRLALAEDAVQFAMVQALELWPYDGVPEYPQAWLSRVAYNRALDVLRSDRRLRYYDDEKESEIRRQIDELQSANDRGPVGFSQEVIDERLALIFTCCHPQVPRAASVALTLKVVCGFGVEEIARAFLATESTISQRLVRAKKLIREQGIRCEVPSPTQLPERLDAVLEVLYLLFTEGYAATTGDSLIKNDLCEEAIRLGKSLAENSVTAQPEVHALLALMLFQAARLPARTDEFGDLLLLEDQDRGLWDRAMIHRGLLYLERAAAGDKLSTYHLQAEIAAIHANTDEFTLTNWKQILALYDLLAEKQPTPVVLTNRAIAVAELRGPVEGLAALAMIDVDGQLARYPFLHLAEGEFHRRLGHLDDAARSFSLALECARTEPERRFIQKKLVAIGSEGRGAPDGKTQASPLKR
jgi:RNA polymerase sigma-70 factor (ECF subfamily)